MEDFDNRLDELHDFFYQASIGTYSKEELSEMLRVAAWHGEVSDVEWLMFYGADPNHESTLGNTAYDVAEYRRDSLPGASVSFSDLIEAMEESNPKRVKSDKRSTAAKKTAPAKKAAAEKNSPVDPAKEFNDNVKKLKGKNPNKFKMRKPKAK